MQGAKGLPNRCPFNGMIHLVLFVIPYITYCLSLFHTALIPQKINTLHPHINIGYISITNIDLNGEVFCQVN